MRTLKDGDDQARAFDICSVANWTIKVGLETLVVRAKLNAMQTAFVDEKAVQAKAEWLEGQQRKAMIAAAPEMLDTVRKTQAYLDRRNDSLTLDGDFYAGKSSVPSCAHHGALKRCGHARVGATRSWTELNHSKAAFTALKEAMLRINTPNKANGAATADTAAEITAAVPAKMVVAIAIASLSIGSFSSTNDGALGAVRDRI